MVEDRNYVLTGGNEMTKKIAIGISHPNLMLKSDGE
jgi:hypothetical protein